MYIHLKVEGCKAQVVQVSLLLLLLILFRVHQSMHANGENTKASHKMFWKISHRPDLPVLETGKNESRVNVSELR